MKPLQEQAEEYVSSHPEIAAIVRDAFLAGADVGIEQIKQWEKTRADAANVMGEILDGNLYRAQRKARWWLTLHQCSGV